MSASPTASRSTSVPNESTSIEKRNVSDDFDFSSISQNNNIINALHMYARNGFKAEILKLIKKEGKSVLQLTDPFHRQNILHVITDKGQEELFILIFTEKYFKYLDVNGIDFNGWTPLHYACKGGHLDMVEALINRGSFVRALSNDGSTPLHYLVRNVYENNVKFHRTFNLLVKKGGGINFINISNKFGETALHQAASRGNCQSMLFLLNSKADPNITNCNGETALHLALQNDNASGVELLLQFGGDPTRSSDHGDIYEISCKNNLYSIQTTLQKWHQKTSRPIPPLLQEALDAHPNIQPIDKSDTSPSSQSPPPSSSPNDDHHTSLNLQLNLNSSSVNNNTKPINTGASTPRQCNNTGNNHNNTSTPSSSNSGGGGGGNNTSGGTPNSAFGGLSAANKLKARKSDNSSSVSYGNNSPVSNNSLIGGSSKRKALFRLKRNGNSKQDLKTTQFESDTKIHTIIESFEVLSSPPLRSPRNTKPTTRHESDSSKNYRSVSNANLPSYSTTSPPSTPPIINNNIPNNNINNNSNSSSSSSNIIINNNNIGSGSGSGSNNNNYIKSNSNNSLNNCNINNSQMNGENNNNGGFGSTELKQSDSFSRLTAPTKNSSLDPLKFTLSNEIKKKFERGWSCKYCDNKHAGIPLTFICVSPKEYEDLADEVKEVRSKISSDLCSVDNLHFFVRGLIEIPLLPPQLPPHLLAMKSNNRNSFNSNNSNSSSIVGGSGSGNNNSTSTPIDKMKDESSSESEQRTPDHSDIDEDDDQKSKPTTPTPIPIPIPTPTTPIPIETEDDNEKLKVIIGVWVKLEALDFFKVMDGWNDVKPFTVMGKLSNNLPLNASIQTLNLSVSLTTRPEGLRPVVAVVNHPEHQLSIYQNSGITLETLESLISNFVHSHENIVLS